MAGLPTPMLGTQGRPSPLPQQRTICSPAFRRDVTGVPTVAWVGARAPAWITDDIVALRPPADPPQPIRQSCCRARSHGSSESGRIDPGRRSGLTANASLMRFSTCSTAADDDRWRAARSTTTRLSSRTRGSSVLVVCPRHGCLTSRRAWRADLDLWAVYMDQRCGRCGTVLTSAQGTTWFYRCPHDGCTFTAPIS